MAANRRQRDAQAKIAKRQSELFRQKEADAMAVKRQSELFRQKEAEAKTVKRQSKSLQEGKERRQRDAKARKRYIKNA